MKQIMSRKAFESLPFREDITGDYVAGQFYRVKSDSTTVSQWNGDPTQVPDKQANWWNFPVEVTD